MPQSGVQLFDKKNAIAFSDPLALARMPHFIRKLPRLEGYSIHPN